MPNEKCAVCFNMLKTEMSAVNKDNNRQVIECFGRVFCALWLAINIQQQ